MDYELTKQLNRIIESGEKALSCTYKLDDGYKVYEKWRTDCIQFFDNIQDTFSSIVKSPTDIRSGIKFLEELLKGNDLEDDCE